MVRQEMSDKNERIQLSGKKEDLLFFPEQFEARIFVLKFHKVLDGSSTFEYYVPSTSPNASRAKKDAAIAKGREIFLKKQIKIWCELVSALDKQSVLYLRPCKRDGAQAWDVLTKRFRSFENSRLQKLVSELTSLVKRDDESLIEYITRAEELQYNLNQVKAGLSEKMFKSILLKGLPNEFTLLSHLLKTVVRVSHLMS